jgi:hypothetical protein
VIAADGSQWLRPWSGRFRCGARSGNTVPPPLTQQAISQHIAVLKQAGLLTERRVGTRRLYALRHEALDPVRSLLAEFWPDALARLKDAVERTRHPEETR